MDSVVVRLSPFGCSRFSDRPVSELTDKVLDGQTVFGPDVLSLYHAIKQTEDLSTRVSLMDSYFLKRFREPNPVDKVICEIADRLRKEPESVSFESINKSTPLPLSARQMARRFKKSIGVNLQAYIRICRFEIAKSLFFRQQNLSLTHIGYQSGYYDQAHFSREFKKLSGLNAKDFFPACSLQKILHKK